MKRRVAILISGRGSNMAALIKAAMAEDFPAEIVVVISNRGAGVPTCDFDRAGRGFSLLADTTIPQRKALPVPDTDAPALDDYSQVVTRIAAELTPRVAAVDGSHPPGWARCRTGSDAAA